VFVVFWRVVHALHRCIIFIAFFRLSGILSRRLGLPTEFHNGRSFSWQGPQRRGEKYRHFSLITQPGKGLLCPGPPAVSLHFMLWRESGYPSLLQRHAYLSVVDMLSSYKPRRHVARFQRERSFVYLPIRGHAGSPGVIWKVLTRCLK
jgi:hypothetical protein